MADEYIHLRNLSFYYNFNFIRIERLTGVLTIKDIIILIFVILLLFRRYNLAKEILQRNNTKCYFKIL
jgi:hypothetical protein